MKDYSGKPPSNRTSASPRIRLYERYLLDNQGQALSQTVLFGLSGVSAPTSVVSRVFQTRDDGKKIAKKKTVVKKKNHVISNNPFHFSQISWGEWAAKRPRGAKPLKAKGGSHPPKGRRQAGKPPQQRTNPRPFLFLCAACALAERGTLDVSRSPQTRSRAL